ncbi:M48 family metallopeptidase [Bacillus alkalisoli]|uniref:M48 family metallopeptidase n=1 Tax=Bacillus alkalisoli TaxID=2011008 RepID=UPI000C24A828|nr:M48 family metallopeptidase [Bacillus alkalisoli]
MKKIIVSIIGAYIVYAVVMYIYLSLPGVGDLPEHLIGTRADPATFLTTEQLFMSQEYSKVRNFLYFLSVPFEWIVYFILLITGVGRLFQHMAEKSTRRNWIQAGIYVFFLSLLVTLVSFPLKVVRYFLAKQYNILVQSFPHWMRDQFISFLEGFILLWIVVLVVYFVIRKFRTYWWVITWLLFIPFIFFFMYIQPIFIDPLYNDFYPLQDKQLEAEILNLAEQANVPADRVFEVNMSEKTNAINAYVTGVGGNSRIVLWDTLLQNLTKEEILFIMAHEIGHYDMNHVTIGVFGYVIFSLLAFFLINLVVTMVITKWGLLIHIKDRREYASLPLFILAFSILLFVVSPITNYISRHQEHTADVYAIELTNNTDAAIGAFQELTKASLSEVNPPRLIKIFRYTHPPMADRIHYLETYRREE